MERTISRLWIALMVIILLLVVTNSMWLWYESQFEDVTTITQESDAKDGGTAIVNNGGDLRYGESEANDN